MNFEYTEEQRAIQDSVERLCERFDDQYWLDTDNDGRFPEEFYQAMASEGWLGICTPEQYGGAGLGIMEAAIMMRTVAESGAGMTGASAIHINIFGLKPVDIYGNEQQRERMLRPIATGTQKACFGVTEPNVGLNTTQLKLRAEKKGDRYIVNGQKIWISTAQVADNILLLARTTPLEEVKRPSEGLSLFYTKLDRNKVQVSAIPKMGRHGVDSNELFFDDFEIPQEDLIGEEGQGFKYILFGLNPERILIAAEAVGLGMAALRKATNYANEREVFNRPIGQNQAIQHPLAASWAELEATWLQVLKAAWLYDNDRPCGAEANAAKYLAGEAGFTACERAVMTHGGFGYAKEYHVERYLREVMIPRIAPVSPQLALCYIAERVLDLPKSY
ncbi:MAG TPA: acyl-CoA dehydrogenase family protein [Paenalcaligenes sp.]|nr:acyl-CoA dehydrogenase family protein [Paenalcaligenes sp.]